MPHKTIEARRAYEAKYRAANADKITAKRRKWVVANPEAYREHRRAFTRRTKLAVIEAYGAKCACCAETLFEFLTIDHIHNDGRRDRLNGIYGLKFYRWLLRNGCPKDRFRLLCMNCNFARGKFGYCPHERASGS